MEGPAYGSKISTLEPSDLVAQWLKKIRLNYEFHWHFHRGHLWYIFIDLVKEAYFDHVLAESLKQKLDIDNVVKNQPQYQCGSPW